jgi:soluble lytic murein transglycosylase
LANAYRAKHNGDYEQAKTEFLTVAQAVSSTVALAQAQDVKLDLAEAQYQAGACSVLTGDYEAAQDLLLAFLREHPEDHRAGAAHYHLAQAAVGLDQRKTAIEHYRAYLELQDVLADLIYTRIALNHVYLGQYSAAISAYELALERAQDLGQQYDLREQIAAAHSAAGNYQEAIDWLGEIADRSQNVYRLARIWYLIGQNYRLAGQEEMALDAFARAVDGDPRPGYAHLALVELVNAEAEVSEFQRGLINYHAGSYDAAVAAFERYMDSVPDYDSDAHYYAALSYLSAGSDALAVQESDRALSRFPSTVSHWGDLWLTKARALAGMGETDQAVEAYIGFAKGHPEHPLAPQARWEAGQLLESADQLVEAAGIYAYLADQHANADVAPRARFRAGLCRYRAGDVDAAEATWRELVATYPGSTEAAQSRYWLGKTLWSQGSTEEGRALLQSLATDYPRNYYGMRAAHLLEQNGQVRRWISAPANLVLTSDRDVEAEKVSAWLRTWAGVADDASLTEVSPRLTDDVRFHRGLELLNLGLRSQARDEFDSLRRDLDQDPLALCQLALLTQDQGLYPPSLRAAIDLITLAPEASVLDMPPLIQRLAFPVYYADLVMAESLAYEIDPLLMFALIRQESVFDDQVASWAGAVGLAQIMPSTGEWIAEMMPWSQYDEALLRRAFLNVKFGAWFLSRILQGTDGDVMAALAGYNGGPANATRWLEEAGGDPDLFVEIITRSEPQLYVREIYRHYDVYSRLYGAG